MCVSILHITAFMVLWNTWDILYVTVLVSWSIPFPPLPAAATYRAGGRHSPTRSRPNFPDPGFKTFPKIIPDFSAIESRVRPPLGSKLAPPHCQGWKKAAKRKTLGGGNVVPRNCKQCSRCTMAPDEGQRRVAKRRQNLSNNGNIFPKVEAQQG